MKNLFNCPNCGAPINDDHCPYCGTVFLDWASFDVDRPTFVKVRDCNGRLFLVRLSTPGATIKFEADPQTYYEHCGGLKHKTTRQLYSATIDATFDLVPFQDPVTHDTILFKTLMPDEGGRVV